MPILTDAKNFIHNEFSNLNLGDKRLNARVLEVAEKMNAGPALSIPAMTSGNDSQLKAIYRFFQNERIDDQAILETHFLNTVERMETYTGKILLLNDSCFVTPVKSFEGLLTRGKGKENCVRTHYCLAVSENGKNLFGILSFHVLSDPIQERYPELRNESDIWIRTAQDCLNLIHSRAHAEKLLARCLFVADREADEFELIDFLKKNNLGFIIRSQYDRKIIIDGREAKLDEIEIYSKGHGKSYKVNVLADKAMKEVEVKRSVLRDIEIIPPIKIAKEFSNIKVNVVMVKDLPGQEDLVEWRLLTSEVIDNSEQSQFVVESYTHRWKIEEVNKGAKTGVRVEERQFTNLDHFIPFLAMAFVLAWRIVALRTVVEINPETPIKEGFTKDEVDFLKVQGKKLGFKMRNLKDALSLIARLGGFTGRYERPGWQILWQGWIRFYERVAGFMLARGS